MTKEEYSVAEIRAMIAKVAGEYSLNPVLFDRQIALESDTRWKGGREYDYKAVNEVSGCRGLGQLHPKFFLLVDPFDPIENLTVSARYMRDLLGRWGTWEKALAAYNWGGGRLTNLLRDHPTTWMARLPNETRTYIRNILLPKERLRDE